MQAFASLLKYHKFIMEIWNASRSTLESERWSKVQVHALLQRRTGAKQSSIIIKDYSTELMSSTERKYPDGGENCSENDVKSL